MTLLEEAEAKLIGTLIQNRAVFLDVKEKLRAEDFLDQAYQTTFAVLTDLYQQNEVPVELNELCELVAKQVRAGNGTLVKILSAVEEAVTAQSVPWALGRVLDASKRRYLQKALSALFAKIDHVEDIQDVFSELLRVTTEGAREAGQVYAGPEIADSIMEIQTQRRTSTDPIGGHRTGFSTVDAHLGGLKPGRVGLLSGGYGQGKTALAINWIGQIAVENKTPSLFVSLEMDVSDVEDRLLGLLSGNTLTHLGTGAMNASAYDTLQQIKRAPLYVTDNYPRDITDICFLIEKHVRIAGIKVVVLDYVGEMVRDAVKFREDRDERYSRWVKSLRDLAKRLNFHILILAQVNFEGHLAESKKMAAHADYYLHLDHTKAGQQYLEMRKNRFGPRDYLYAISYDKQTQKMREQGILDQSE